MPLHLPQLSRREFLRRAALAGAGWGLAPLLPSTTHAESKPTARDPDTFVFFSDTHIAADPALNHNGINMADHLKACVSELTPMAPAAVIMNGDLAFNHGKPEDYATFGKLIEPVRLLAPVHLSLGNHDARENFWEAFPLDAAPSSTTLHRQAAVLTSARANWFLLDSLHLTNHTPGELGAAQLSWLKQELAARRDKPALIVAHHPLDFFGLAGLKDTWALEELFQQHRHIKAFIFGHTHTWQIETHFTGVQLINLPPTGYVFSEGRPSGWVRCQLGQNGAEFELRALDTSHSDHARIKKLVWRQG